LVLADHLQIRSKWILCVGEKLGYPAPMQVKTSVFLLVVALGACKKPEPKKEADAKPQVENRVQAPSFDPAQARALFKALPERFDASAQAPSSALVDLERTLFYEARLSKNHDVSCNSCHDLSKFGVDGMPTSKGHKGQLGGRNSPTVYHAAGHFVQFWDGRAQDVEEQAKGPVLNPVEMAAPSEAHVVSVLSSIPEYVTAFKAAFPADADPVTYDNMAKAIGAFERGLVAPSPFDDFLKGDDKALSDAQKAGLNTFMQTGCTACHNGVLVGGSMYQKLGAVKPYAGNRDEGRFDVTKAESDRLMFKVPSLRNVEKTAPYFHDGKIPDLKTAVKTMADIQLGRQLSDAEADAIVAFLGSLTGRIDEKYIAKPTLPPSTDKTPKPDPS
jgi:cytochrome c peroxidase